MSCKWINGKFNPCSKFDGSVEIGFTGTVGDPEAKRDYTYCRKCRVDILKPSPTPPSHEEIMSNFWLDGWCWLKVIGVNQKQYFIFSAKSDDHYSMPMMLKTVDRDWFTDRKSALIPPEG